MRKIIKRYWFGEMVLGAFFLSVILFAALMAPSSEVLSFFGYDIPVMCGFRRATGYGCPGCGLTRSFAFMAHGNVSEAFQMNYLGPILFSAFATQPPYRLFKALQDIHRNGLFGEKT